MILNKEVITKADLLFIIKDLPDDTFIDIINVFLHSGIKTIEFAESFKYCGLEFGRREFPELEQKKVIFLA